MAGGVVDVRNGFVENSGDVAEQFGARSLWHVTPIGLVLHRFFDRGLRGAVDYCPAPIGSFDKDLGSLIEFLPIPHHICFSISQVIALLGIRGNSEKQRETEKDGLRNEAGKCSLVLLAHGRLVGDKSLAPGGGAGSLPLPGPGVCAFSG